MGLTEAEESTSKPRRSDQCRGEHIEAEESNEEAEVAFDRPMDVPSTQAELSFDRTTCAPVCFLSFSLC
jgi:hypothetical protein